MTPHVTGAASAKPIWRRIARRFLPYRLRVVTSMLLAVTAVSLNIIGPLLLRQVINIALPRHDIPMLATLCAAMLGVAAITAAIAVVQSMLTNSVGQDVMHQLRADVYERVHRMPLTFFSGESNADIQARLASDIGGISDIVTFTALSTLTAATNIAAAALVMLLLSWPLALISLALTVPLSLLNRRFTVKRRTLAEDQQERVAEMLRLVSEHLSLPGVVLGRTLNMRERQRSAFTVVSKQIARATYRQRIAGSSARAITGATLACLPPIIYFLAGARFPGLSLGTVVVLATIQVRLSGPIQQMLGISANVQSSRVMFERVFDYLDMGPEVDVSEPDRVSSAPPALHLRAVSYCYTQNGRRAVDGIDLELPPRSTTLITGPTGSGKSTLAMIIAGLLEPLAGTVEVGTQPVSAATLWHYVTVAAQDAAFFNASIRENLMFARPEATEPDLRAVLSDVRLGEFVDGMRDGLDTVIGERGYQLSGGERARLALARAMLASSPVLIVDEVTSSLDSPTAAAVFDALRAHCAGRTLVIIAHRMPSLQPGDRVLALEHGRVARCAIGAEPASQNFRGGV